eukprot:gene20631-22665_t
MSGGDQTENLEESQLNDAHSLSIRNSSSFDEVIASEVTDHQEHFSSRVAFENDKSDLQNQAISGVASRNFDNINCTNENGHLRENDSLQQNLSPYPSMHANSLMNDTEQHTTQQGNNIEKENCVNQNATTINEEEANRIQLMNSQADEEMQNADKSMFTSVTLLTTSEDSNRHQQETTFLPTQAMSPVHTSSGHAIINSADISDAFSDSFSNGSHYIVPALQTVSQPGNSSVVLLQVPGPQASNHVVVAQVSNGQIQQASVPVNISEMKADTETNIDQNVDKTAGTKARGKGRAKLVKPLRPLAPRMFAVPVSSPVIIPGPSGHCTTGTNTTDDISGFKSSSPHSRFCRTTTYCRAEKNHTDVRAAACAECEQKGNSTVVCRRKRQHKEPNAFPANIVINVALQRSADLKEMCLKNSLPPCFSELHSLTVHHADCIFAQPRKPEAEDNLMTIDGAAASSENVSYRKPTDYARGYLHPYSKDAWDQWLAKFCAQSRTSYRIRTGKRVNKKTDHGLANHNGKIVVYRALETQLYNCSLGGKPRRKTLREGSRRRKARGSKLIGCSAVIHTRLIVTEDNWTGLEITVPKLTAHLPSHDPRMASNEIQTDMNDMILSPSLYCTDQGVESAEQEEFAILEDVNFHAETATHDQLELLNSPQIENVRKHIKSLLENSVGLVDELSNVEILKSTQTYVQSLFNELCRIVNTKRSRKRTAVEANLVNDEVLEEGESTPSTVNQVVLLQSEHD